MEKYLAGKKGIEVENRMRILRLIENMTMGRNAVGYLTESMHGAGSPQAQRIQIARQMQLGYKKQLAKNLAKVKEDPEEMKENSEYFKRVFKIPEKIILLNHLFYRHLLIHLFEDLVYSESLLFSKLLSESSAISIYYLIHLYFPFKLLSG